VGTIAEKKGWAKALIVTDKGVSKAGLLDGIIDSLNSVNVGHEIFDEVQPNPTDTSVEKGAELLKKDGSFDFIIAVGGGSSIDTGKGIALLATNPGTLRDYEGHTVEDFYKTRINHLFPLIAVPTTSGTGSEVGYWAIITDRRRKVKMAIAVYPENPGDSYLGPTAALVDPVLTLSLPRNQTAATGFDALCHALETYVARAVPGGVPMIGTGSLALDCIELLAKFLPIAYSNGNNLEARENVMLAALMAGVAINFGAVGAIHALASKVIGTYENITHGICCAIFAPHVMQFNSAVVPEKYAKVAAAMGEEISGLTAAEASKKGIDAVKRLMRELSVPTNLRGFGVQENDFPNLAKGALETVQILTNPRKPSYDDLLKLIKDAYVET
jgi:alcohol dehydrogenase class IV